MIAIFLTMIGGLVLGLVTRGRVLSAAVTGRAITGAIMALMLLIGVETGATREVLLSAGLIVGSGVGIAMAGLAGTFGAAWAINHFLLHEKGPKTSDYETRKQGGAGRYILSFGIVGLFFVGVGVGLIFSEGGEWARGVSMWFLYALMGLVGYSLGCNRGLLGEMFRQRKVMFLLPVATVVGTLSGVIIFSWAWGWSLSEQLAVGSGFGYYSLSSALIGGRAGAALGAVALIANVTRELITVAGAGIITRRLSPVSLICAGGATTMDVTLPVITRFGGERFAPVAIAHGAAVDFCVPYLVTLFLAFGQ